MDHISPANIKLVVFDIDGTLAPSKSPVEHDMALLLAQLLNKKLVAVMSGGSYKQISEQFVASLPSGIDYKNLFIFPTCGTSMYAFENNVWHERYADHFTAEEKKMIMDALKQALDGAGYVQPEQTFGEIIEDRDSQITFSALGQLAPLDLKSAWDPDRSKRAHIIQLLQSNIPGFEARIGGTTSIDITRAGRDKAFGINAIVRELGVPISEMIFVGDSLDVGGNDESVKKTGIVTVAVAGPDETAVFIKTLL